MAKNKKLPAGITQRGSRFRVSVMVSGVRRTVTCESLQEAVQQAEAIRAGTLADKAGMPPVWTLGEAGDSFLRERVQVRSSSAASVRTRMSTVKQVLDFFGEEVSVDAITYAEVMRFSNHLRAQQGYSSNYTNVLLINLKGILDHAWRSGRKAEAPSKIDLVKGKGARIRYLTPEEEEACLGWCHHHIQNTLADAFMLLIDTGLRVGELCALTWQDVDLTADRIHIWSSKSREPRAVGLTQRVKNILQRRKLGSRDTKVFGGLTYPQLRHLWEGMRAGLGKADDKDFVIHALRHTCCTRLVSAGIDLRTVQKWMGHEDIKTTMRYAQFVPANLCNAAAALEPAKPDLRVMKGE